MEDHVEHHVVKKGDEQPRRRPKKLFVPRRRPTMPEVPREIIFITADKTTCAKCLCFPKEDPYVKPKKINPCQKTPLTLYELAAAVVDHLEYPSALEWSKEDVADWMENVVGLPEYKSCILENEINGRRLLLLEDPSRMPEINIHYFDHIKMITAKIHELFHTEDVLFSRSIGLPPRKLPTLCTWFKSKTGPTWGIRRNWSRSDIFRWMKIINPAPEYFDHWDLVWYLKPDFPKTLFGKIPKPTSYEEIPHYKKPVPEPPCKEYKASRKFRLRKDLTEEEQKIWMEHGPESPETEQKEKIPRKRKEQKDKIKKKVTIPKKTRLDPPRISLTGLSGDKLLLARRLLPKKKFLA